MTSNSHIDRSYNYNQKNDPTFNKQANEKL